MTRDEAFTLVTEWTTKPALINHMLAVEAVMRHMAKHFGEDVDAWGLAGLLHDFDYEKHITIPEHPVNGVAFLREKGIDEATLQTILGHANLPEYPRTTLMDKALFAADELTGLVMAVVYVRPSKSIKDVEVSSVKKKLKDKTFAAGVNREDIYQGAAELNLEVDKLIQLVIDGLSAQADALGLDGPK